METSAFSSSSVRHLPEHDHVGSVPEIRVRPFRLWDEVAFRELNEAWIAKYFSIEDAERPYLENPIATILTPGGYIFLAVAGNIPVGCCALIPTQPGEFELAKMAVQESLRGRGIGRKILDYTIAHARNIGATRLYLETNRKLANAIHLYESVGFEHVAPEQVIPSPYARANVFMEMSL